MSVSIDEHIASLVAHTNRDETDTKWNHCPYCGTWYILDMGCPYCKGDPNFDRA